MSRLKEVLGRSSSTGDLWVGTHSQTKHKIVLKQRVDRVRLLSLYEQQRQTLQVTMSSFGPVGSEHVQLDRDHPTLKKALAMMIPLATQFCQNELAKKDLKAARDRVMKIIEEGASDKP